MLPTSEISAREEHWFSLTVAQKKTTKKLSNSRLKKYFLVGISYYLFLF